MNLNNFKDPTKEVIKIRRRLRKAKIRAEEAESALHKLVQIKATLEEEVEFAACEREKLYDQISDLQRKVERLSRDAEGFILLRHKEVIRGE